MCCIWKVRQDKLGIDDFGKPVDPLIYPTINTDEVNHQPSEIIIVPYEPITEGATLSQDGDEVPTRKVDAPAGRKGWFAWFGRL
jgi:hypothetical protein